jgi:hypothetical protein
MSEREEIVQKIAIAKQRVLEEEENFIKLQNALREKTIEIHELKKLEVLAEKELEIYDTVCSVCNERINKYDECGCEWSK